MQQQYQRINSICLYISLLKAVQKEREERLVKSLKDFLSHYVRGDKVGFLHRADSEAKRLANAGLCDLISHFCQVIYVYLHWLSKIIF